MLFLASKLFQCGNQFRAAKEVAQKVVYEKSLLTAIPSDWKPAGRQESLIRHRCIKEMKCPLGLSRQKFGPPIERIEISNNS